MNVTVTINYKKIATCEFHGSLFIFNREINQERVGRRDSRIEWNMSSTAPLPSIA